MTDSKWISVKERLPELRKSYKSPAPYVLAVDAAGRMSVGYADERSYGHSWVFAKPIGNPTHWMPLPEPPNTTSKPSDSAVTTTRTNEPTL